MSVLFCSQIYYKMEALLYICKPGNLLNNINIFWIVRILNSTDIGEGHGGKNIGTAGPNEGFKLIGRFG